MPAARKEMQQITSSMTVPVVKAGDRVLVGFSAAEYEEAFKNWP